jgi:hypothetical protein
LAGAIVLYQERPLHCTDTALAHVVVVRAGCGGVCCAVLFLTALHQWELSVTASLECLNLAMCCHGMRVACTTRTA